MGFIQPGGTQVSLQAFLTQKGREYLVTGQPDDFRIAYFALGDPDTNYLQASQLGASGAANILPAGFVPDLSGDYASTIRSMASGVTQDSFLRGGSTIGQLGTAGELGGALSHIGFGPSRLGEFRDGHVASPNFTATLPVPIRVTSGAVIGGEQVRLYILPPSQGTSAFVYPHVSLAQNGIVSWAAGDAANKQWDLNIQLPLLPPVTPADQTVGGFRFKIFVAAVPYKSSVLVPQATALYGVELQLYLNARYLPSGGGLMPPG